MPALQTFLSGDGDRRQALVVVFLRGAADGLNMVAPLEDDGYYRARPRIAVEKSKAAALDHFYGLNPLLADLAPAYHDGHLAVVHAAGSEDSTRSHFEAQDLMEHGGIAAGGWLGRFLRFRPDATAGALSAIAVGRSLPECLRGAPSATVMRSLDDFTLGGKSASLRDQLSKLYAVRNDRLSAAGRDTLDALQRIDRLRNTPYQAANGAVYSPDEFSQGLRQVARLIKARVGLEAASIDLNGWDSHFNQGVIMDPRMLSLSRGLSAFYRDLGREMESTTVVVMTEFGRRVVENSAFGTDHGRGSVMFVLGGGIKGGRVISKWTALKEDLLEGPGDLPVTTNYRNILAPILQKHGAGEDLSRIFPDFELKPENLYG